MKTYFGIVLILLSLFSNAQNTLLSSAQTGQPFTTGKIDDIALISNGTYVALVGANNVTGKLYVIDINDNNPADATANTITSITTFKTKIETALGVGAIAIRNFEVNPISKSVYVLAQQGTKSYIAIVKNNGNSITALNLTNVSYCTLTFSSSNYNIQDLTWGNNTLFVSASNSALDGEIGGMTAPFVHNSTFTKRSTTMFKSNWGTVYWTDAPLEKMDFNVVSGIDRLSGVTVCAPGFSLPTSAVNGSGLLQVTEDFDMFNGPVKKVVADIQGNTAYLMDLHDDNFSGNYSVYRIGQKYLDGSQVGATKYNLNSEKLRTNGNVANGLTDAELKKYPGNYTMIAFYANCKLLVLTNTDVLQLLVTGTNCATAVNEVQTGNSSFSLYPNPANDYIIISIGDSKLNSNAQIVVCSIDGKEVLRQNYVDNNSQKIDVSFLSKGSYILSVLSDNKAVFNDTFIK